MARRPLIDLTKPLHEKADDYFQALVAANAGPEPGVMVRGNALVRMTSGGKLEQHTAESLRDELSKAAQGSLPSEDSYTPKDPPRDVAVVLLERDESAYSGLGHVERVVDVPVCVPGDERPRLITATGLDRPSRVYYRPDEKLEGVGPLDAGTTEDVEWALEFLMDEWLGDFDFDDAASAAHALSLLLLPFVRELVDGSTPLHVVLAPDVGSGKTWLAQAALLPGCGLVPATPGTGSEEEWRKRITSMLLGSKPAILLDNLSGKLDSGALALALTSDRWTDRILGESKEVTLDVHNVWAVTGNNLGLAREQIRRAIPVYLDPGAKKPAERERTDFRHPDLLNWGLDHRRELVQAALTLIEHWRLGPVGLVEGGYVFNRIEDAEPIDGQATLGSFERWAGVIGGILESAQVPGFLGNRERLKAEADDDTSEAVDFLSAWHRLELDPMTFQEVVAACQFGEPLRDFLPVELGTAGRDFDKALNVWLKRWKEVHAGGYRLLNAKLGGAGNHRRWYVQQRAEESSG